MDDVVYQVMLTEGDEDLLAGDAPCAVVGPTPPWRAPVRGRSRLRLGQVHGAGPLAAHHLAQEGGLLPGAAVLGQHLDGALGQQRAQREPHAGGGHHLLHHDGDQPREPAAAELGRERHRSPAGLDVLPVRLAEPGRGRDLAIAVKGAARGVADPVERAHHVGHEPAALLDHPEHGLGIGMAESLELGQAIKIDKLLQNEPDVTERGNVASHGLRVSPARRKSSARRWRNRGSAVARAAGGNHTAGQDHRTHDPGNPVPAGQHRRQAAGRRVPSPGSPEPRTRQRQPSGHGDRRRPAAAGPAPHASVAASVKSASHL